MDSATGAYARLWVFWGLLVTRIGIGIGLFWVGDFAGGFLGGILWGCPFPWGHGVSPSSFLFSIFFLLLGAQGF